jgi:DNA-binding transcriptional ArsR family regulator
MAARKKQPSGKPTDPLSTKTAKGEKKPFEQRLIKGLASPLRARILAFLNDRMWSPRELSDELDEGLSQVSYHVKVLRDLELIKLIKTEPRRGAVEHFYMAVERAIIPPSMAKQIPKSGRLGVLAGIMEEIDTDVGASLASGRFYKRDDYHASWTPMDLDGQAVQEAEAIADEAMERFLALGPESEMRRVNGEGDGEHIPTSAAILVFGSERAEMLKAPPRKKKASAKKKPRGRKKRS